MVCNVPISDGLSPKGGETKIIFIGNSEKGAPINKPATTKPVKAV